MPSSIPAELNNMPLTLVKTSYSHSVSMDLYHEFENVIINRSNWSVVKGVSSIPAHIIRKALKILNPISIPIQKNNIYLIVGYQKEKFFPYFSYKAPLKALWMYDAWEPLFKEISNIVELYGINLLLLSSKQAAEHFSQLNNDNFKAIWVPEAITTSNYKFLPYDQRKIDILQLGRKWADYHESIKLLENKYTYLYEKQAGEIIFKTRKSFIDGLANAKISICVPSNFTHPERTGNISTLTYRYLQSMASKCLILGKPPLEITDIFDYNPLIDIDEQHPVSQIEDLLSHYEDYIPLVEKNYLTVKNYHQWESRIELIEKTIQNFIKDPYCSQ